MLVACAALLSLGQAAPVVSVAVQQESAVLETVASAPLLSYQGRLLNPASGEAKADGTYAMSFKLYTALTGGTALWTENKNVSVRNGLFSTLLGDTTALNLANFNGQELYLGVTVGSDPEARPRQRLAHTAYAIYAEKAATASTATTAGNADTVDGQHAAAFAPASHTHNGAAINAGKVGATFVDEALTRDSEVLTIIKAGDGAGSGVDADTVDGFDATAFAPAGHTHDGVYYARNKGVQATRTLVAGTNTTISTHSWPLDWQVEWTAVPTTVGGQATISVVTLLEANGLYTYIITIANVGSVTSDIDVRYAVLQ